MQHQYPGKMLCEQVWLFFPHGTLSLKWYQPIKLVILADTSLWDDICNVLAQGCTDLTIHVVTVV